MKLPIILILFFVLVGCAPKHCGHWALSSNAEIEKCLDDQGIKHARGKVQPWHGL